jgi:hypothetical protein
MGDNYKATVNTTTEFEYSHTDSTLQVSAQTARSMMVAFGHFVALKGFYLRFQVPFMFIYGTYNLPTLLKI